jgi:hypothetical protein
MELTVHEAVEAATAGVTTAGDSSERSSVAPGEVGALEHEAKSAARAPLRTTSVDRNTLHLLNQ